MKKIKMKSKTKKDNTEEIIQLQMRILAMESLGMNTDKEKERMAELQKDNDN